MPIDGYTTSIAASETAVDITKLLTKAGASRIVTTYDTKGEPEGLAFMINTEWGPREFMLPIRAEGILATLKRDRVPKNYQTIEHARRVAWRVALKWLQAQLALIDAGMTTITEVMFPHVVVGWDEADSRPQTAFERYTSTQKEISQ